MSDTPRPEHWKQLADLFGGPSSKEPSPPAPSPPVSAPVCGTRGRAAAVPAATRRPPCVEAVSSSPKTELGPAGQRTGACSATRTGSRTPAAAASGRAEAFACGLRGSRRTGRQFSVGSRAEPERAESREETAPRRAAYFVAEELGSEDPLAMTVGQLRGGGQRRDRGNRVARRTRTRTRKMRPSHPRTSRPNNLAAVAADGDAAAGERLLRNPRQR